MEVINTIMNQQEGETLIDISDDEPTLEPKKRKRLINRL